MGAVLQTTDTDKLDTTALLEKLTTDTRELLARNAIAQPIMVGIHSGGVWIAQRLHQQLALSEPLATLDISFYRDDFTRIGINPEVKPSKLPVNIDDRHIILVDDVLHTGRTIRAAMNELFDYGRPASIHLAVLIERSGRELPIQADVCGQHLDLDSHQHIKLKGPDPLRLSLQQSR